MITQQTTQFKLCTKDYITTMYPSWGQFFLPETFWLILISWTIFCPNSDIWECTFFPVVMYGCESWTTKKSEPKNWWFWTVVLEKTLESPLDCKEIQLVHFKGDQSWIFIGTTDAEAETLILWPPDAKNWLLGKDPVAGKDWRQKEKGMTEDEMVGWHHRLDGHEFEQAPGVGDGQGSLACCSPWGCKELDMTK